jgi:signal transduction histidine kinase
VDGEGDEEQVIRVILDRGLISQVLENLLSNALKYTEKVVRDGRKGRFVFCGWKILNDYFGPGKPGIRIWVTSSGNPLDLDDPMEVFKPGFRATNVARESGTGRGLYFVRQVVELHGGKVGYSHAANGNEFYLVLPYEHA